MKTARAYATLLIALLMTIGGCAGPTKVGDLSAISESEKARLTDSLPSRKTLFSDAYAPGILELDGIAPPRMRWTTEYELAPGPHVVKVVGITFKVIGPPTPSKPYLMVFNAEAGKKYVVEVEKRESDWRFWMTDTASGVMVAEIPSADQPILTEDPEPIACTEFTAAIQQAKNLGEHTTAYVKSTLGWREYIYGVRRGRIGREKDACDLLQGRPVEAFLQKVSVYCENNRSATFGTAVESVTAAVCP